MRAKTWLLLVLALAGSGVILGGTTESVKEKQDGLKQIRSEIDKKKKEKKSSARRARELREEVDRISNELQSARKALSAVEGRTLKAERARAEAESRVLASQQDLVEWRDRLSAAIRGYYMRLTLTPEGAVPALVYEQALLSERAKGLSFALENHRNVQSLRDDLAEAEESLRRARLDRKREEHRAELARNRIAELQKTEEGRRLVLDRQIQELNLSAARFEKKIADLILKEQQARARAEKMNKTVSAPAVVSGKAQKWRGRLPWPAGGEVVEKFGRTVDAEMGVPTLSNGVTVRPGTDVPVKAILDGEVLFAGPFMNYGLMALVSHPDHLHSIYAHLGGLRVVRGQHVVAGEPMGDSGRDERGRPLVYFELRADGQPVNPESWCRR